jgi:hypothetical protein
MSDEPKADLRHVINSQLQALSKESLVHWLNEGQRHHNEFCRRAAKWRLQASALSAALEPFTQIAFPVKYQDAVNARIVYRQTRNDLDENFKEVTAAVRIAIAALKQLESQGNPEAAAALVKIRQIEPGV